MFFGTRRQKQLELLEANKNEIFMGFKLWFLTIIQLLIFIGMVFALPCFFNKDRILSGFAFAFLILGFTFLFLICKSSESMRRIKVCSYLMIVMTTLGALQINWIVARNLAPYTFFIIMAFFVITMNDDPWRKIMFYIFDYGSVIATKALVYKISLMDMRLEIVSMLVTLFFASVIGIVFQQKQFQNIDNAKKIHSFTTHDVITGLQNRTAMSNFFEKVDGFEDRKRIRALYAICIDETGVYSGSYGVKKLDEAIVALAHALWEYADGKGMELFKYRSEKFVLVDFDDTKGVPIDIAKDLINIMKRLEIPNANSKTGHLTVSVGFAISNNSYADNEYSLVSDADAALGYAHRKGNTIIKFNKDLLVHSGDELLGNEVSAEVDEIIKTGKMNSDMFNIIALYSGNRYIFTTNMRTGVSRFSSNAVDYFGLPDEYIEDVASIWSSLIHPADLAMYTEDISGVFSGRKIYHKVDYRIKNKYGEYVKVTCEGKVITSDEGYDTLFTGVITNHSIGDTVDSTTNLYNISAFTSQIDYYMAASKDSDLLIIGVNRFTDVNNSYGYGVGNKVLVQISKEIESVVGKSEYVFKLEAAKFAILAPSSEKYDMEKIFEDIKDRLKSNIYIESVHIPIDIAGVSSHFDLYDIDFNTMIAELNHVLADAKHKRSSDLFRIDSKEFADIREQIRLLDMTKKSVLNDYEGFFLNYQPQFGIEGDLIGVEALVRWRNERFGGVVSPGRFMPNIENDPCSYELGNWIIRTALTEMKPYVLSNPNFKVSINVSHRQIERTEFCNDVMQIVNEVGFPCGNMVLEITEHCRNLHPSILENAITFFRFHGISVYADDFGTGYSSFSIMREHEFDCIKIDQTFILHILENAMDQYLVEAIIRCAKQAGVRVCIEGVETEEILDHVKKYGAEYYQGFLFARPMAIDDFYQKYA